MLLASATPMHAESSRCLSLRLRPQVVRRKHFKRVCSAVEARLFSAKANFLPALSEIMGHVADLQAVNFCSANANHLHTLQGGTVCS